MTDWNPIETAPKDGTHILACIGPFNAHRLFEQCPPTVVHYFPDPDAPGFYTSVNELAPEHPYKATHWMPLPAEPLEFTEETCPGHIASAHDRKICGHCGLHIDSLRQPEPFEP